MSREVSVRQLRNHTADVVGAIRGGERLCLTVNRTPVADIVPHSTQASAWVDSRILREIVAESGADSELLEDLRSLRGELVDEA